MSWNCPPSFWLNSGIRAAALGLVLITASVHAQDAVYYMDGANYVMPGGTSVQAVGTQSFSYDSNPLLLTSRAKSLIGSITSPEAILVDKTPTSTLASDTIFTSNNFNHADFNSNDVHSKLNASGQTEQWTAGLLASVDDDTTRTSEFSAYNNIRSIPVRHLGEDLTPQVGYSILPEDKLNLSGSYQESQYAGNSFTNYNNMSITPSYSHIFDERNTGTLSFEAQRYRALEGLTNVTDSIGPSVGWQKTFSERVTGNATIGFQETRQKTYLDPSPSWQPNVDFSGGLTFKSEQDLINATASRSQYPFGNGTEALLTTLTGSETHSLNEMFSLSGQGSYQSAVYGASAPGNLKSLTSGTLNLTYHATDKVDISATYQYQYETLEGQSSDARSNSGIVSLVFHPTPWSL